MFKRNTLITVSILCSIATHSYANQCSTAPQYVEGTSYTEGEKVRNADKVFRCIESGWCSQKGPYAPGEGWASSQAWEELSTCRSHGGNSKKSLSRATALERSPSKASGSSCDDLDTWKEGKAFVGGTRIQHKGELYQANWWTQGENPEEFSKKSQVWSPLGPCVEVSQRSTGQPANRDSLATR